jgi:thymidylate kinase
LSGIDGSGKSVHAWGLVLKAKRKGIKLKTIWARRVVFSLPMLALCRLIGITQVHVNKNGFRVSDYPFYAYKPLRLAWPWFQLADWFYFDTYLRIRGALSDFSVVFDRYSIDAFVDILADVRTPVGLRWLERLFLFSLMRDMLVVVLDIDEEKSLRRKKDTSCFEYLRRRREAYLQLASKYGWPVVSTGSSYCLTNERIFQILFQGTRLHDQLH